MTKKSPYLFDVGERVEIIDRDGTVVAVGTISKQEWWKANPEHPVYYQIRADNGRLIIPRAPTGHSHHFGDIRRTNR